MKKTFLRILILIIVCISFITRAPAQSFVKENKIWCVAFYPDDQTTPKTNYYKFEGDTLIDSVHYLKTIFSNNFNGPFQIVNALWREENNVVFEISTFNHKDRIFYDFNLKVGDYYYNPWDQESHNNPFVVDSVIIRNMNGIDRKCWYFSPVEWGGDRPVAEVWIEGIGSLTGPFRPIGLGLAGGIEELICVHENGVQIYQNPDYTGCEAKNNSVPIIENSQQLINLYSPEKGMLRLQLINKDIGEITLFSLEGKQLINRKITNAETEISAPTNGLLLYRYINKRGETQTGKVLLP
jgi:hypothetical protein